MIMMIDITLTIIPFFYRMCLSTFRGLCSVYIVYGAETSSLFLSLQADSQRPTVPRVS